MSVKQFIFEAFLVIALVLGVCFLFSGCSASVDYCPPPRRVIYYHHCPPPVYVVPHHHCW